MVRTRAEACASRSRREVAADLGVGLSTLRHWIDRRREREIDAPPEGRQEDMAAELKRLRRENEILRQEREILKKATVSSIDQRNSFSQHSARGSKAKVFLGRVLSLSAIASRSFWL